MVLDLSQLVLYEDNHLLALNKPAGWLTQPSGTEADNIEDRAKAWIKERDQKPGNVFLSAVHRIDSRVSGVVLFAKSSKALARMNQAMRERKTKKLYLAVVEGDWAQESGTLEDWLVHSSRIARVVPGTHEKAKKARLHFQLIKRAKTQSILQVELETGRYHQIRVQFGSRGHPLIGDSKYGASLPGFGKGIGLHHWKLTVPHPTKAESVQIVARLPAEWPER